jgi:undecaprenyl-diphosphatase
MDIQHLIDIIFMAVFQGVAEFLPISSSGHLAVIAKLIGYNPDEVVTTSIALHAGTLLSILVFYFHSLLKLLTQREYRTILLVAAATVPVGILGVTYKKIGIDEFLFTCILVSGIGFLITATFLRFGMKAKTGKTVPLKDMTFKQAILIGVAQAIAILPGISRSGSTIAAALRLGVDKADCARFSFYLAIPTIAGAAVLELASALKDKAITAGALFTPELLIGFVLSAVIGWVSLKLLVAMLNKGKLEYFSWYLYAVGIAVVVWGIVDLL